MRTSRDKGGEGVEMALLPLGFDFCYGGGSIMEQLIQEILLIHMIALFLYWNIHVPTMMS